LKKQVKGNVIKPNYCGAWALVFLTVPKTVTIMEETCL